MRVSDQAIGTGPDMAAPSEANTQASTSRAGAASRTSYRDTLVRHADYATADGASPPPDPA